LPYRVAQCIRLTYLGEIDKSVANTVIANVSGIDKRSAITTVVYVERSTLQKTSITMAD